jgi:hypothetical protein
MDTYLSAACISAAVSSFPGTQRKGAPLRRTVCESSSAAGAVAKIDEHLRIGLHRAIGERETDGGIDRIIRIAAAVAGAGTRNELPRR